jgi:hypothetical protein
MPTILYIMGTGRSGSTMLELLLSNNDRVCGLGEVTHIFRDGFIDQQPCACGKVVDSCPLWHGVQGACGWTPRDYPGLQRLFEHFAWHSRFPFVWLRLRPRAEQRRFGEVNQALFTAVRSRQGVDTVVDSSKYAARALSLFRLFPNRVRVIYLTRSPAALVRAFARRDIPEQQPKSTLATLAYYLWVGLCARLVLNRLGSAALRLRFEDLQADPEGELRRIERWSGIDLSTARAKLRRDDSFEVGHMVTGNRLRKQGRVRFRRPTTPDAATG